ncbi:MAG: class B sortase, partial [Coprobacillaceae bacterium]
MKENMKNSTFINNKQEVGIKVVRGINTIIDYGVMLVFLFMLIFGCYAIWDNNQILYEANATRYETYKPTTNNSISFAELKNINNEVFAWITIYGTEIDYPIAHTDNNSKYLNTNPLGEFSLAGSLYLDYLNNPNFTDFNSIIYGHHMEKDAMFGNLDKFSEESFFINHQYGNLYYGGKDHGLEFFAFLEEDAYNWDLYKPGIETEDAQTEYLSYIYSISKNTRDIGVTSSDQIVLLSTCASDTTNGRYILVGRISDETFENTFDKSQSDDKLNNDLFGGTWTIWKILLWGIIIIIVIILLILLLLKVIER